MRPDDRLLLDLNEYVDTKDVDANLIRRAIKAIIRLRKQRDAVKHLYEACQAMYESTGVTIEVRNALQEYDRRRRPMIKWRVEHSHHGEYKGRVGNDD